MRYRVEGAAMLAEEDGFSLVEMIVVVAILSMTAMIAFFGLQATQRPKSPAALASDVAQLIQFVRLDAINSRQQRPLVIDMVARTISNERGDRLLSVPAHMEMTVVTGRELVRAERRATIIFLPDGSSSGGEVSFKSEQSSALLSIPWLTGIPFMKNSGGNHG